jgi:UDP-2-acetamido-2,6-beta-L-arabino-hexul-4-ose reductase
VIQLRVLVTGSSGFLGWHLKCANKALYGHQLIEWHPPFSKEVLEVQETDAVIHLASRMRGPDHEVIDSNREITQNLLKGLEILKPGIFIHANSTHSGEESAFGQSKAEMSEKIEEKCKALGWNFVDVKFPNIYGEGAKPFHNSFIATVISSLYENKSYKVIDKQINLVSAHEAAKYLLDLCGNDNNPSLVVEETSVKVVVQTLEEFHASYSKGSLPELETILKLKLFNAYRFSAGPKSVKLTSRKDSRGDLVELANFDGGSGTIFASETNHGFSRGNHFHIDKFERFIILSGKGVIEIQELFSSRSYVFEVEGEHPYAVDIPTLSAHKLVNTGSKPLFGIFMAMPKFNPQMPDTYSANL